MIEVGQIQIAKILTEIIANRNTVRRINHFIQEPQQIGVFDFTAKDLFQNIMVNGRIKLTNIKF